MNIIKGDLIKLAKEGHFDVILHGCNCFCKMGKGIAVQIKNEFPEAYKEDLRTQPGDPTKLGTHSAAYIPEYSIIVINAYTQFDYRPTYDNDGITRCDYDAVRKAFASVSQRFNAPNLRFGYPKIGAGLAGGDWEIISKIIDEEMLGRNHTLVEYNGN